MNRNLDPFSVGKVAFLFGEVGDDAFFKIDVLPGQGGGITKTKASPAPQKNQGFPVGVANRKKCFEVLLSEGFAGVLYPHGELYGRSRIVGDCVKSFSPIEERAEHLDLDPLVGGALPLGYQVSHEGLDMVGLDVGDGQLQGGNSDSLDKFADDLPVADEGGFRFGVSFSFKPTLHHLLKCGQLGSGGGLADDAQDLLRKLLGLELLGEVLKVGGCFLFGGGLKFQGQVHGLVAEGGFGGEFARDLVLGSVRRTVAHDPF